MFAVVAHDVVGGYECRNISSCLLWQVGIYLPIIFFASAGIACGFGHVARATVVGCYHQMPILVDVVQIAQVACGGIRCFQRVAAFVHKAVHFQAVESSGGHHKLPQSCCSGARCGTCVQCRLYHGQIFQFERHAVAFEGFFEHRKIVGLPQTEHIFYLIRFLKIHFDEFFHNVVVRHLHHIGQFLQTLDVEFLVAQDQSRIFAAIAQLCVGKVPIVYDFVQVGIKFDRHYNGRIGADYHFQRIGWLGGSDGAADAQCGYGKNYFLHVCCFSFSLSSFRHATTVAYSVSLVGCRYVVRADTSIWRRPPPASYRCR